MFFSFFMRIMMVPRKVSPCSLAQWPPPLTTQRGWFPCYVCLLGCVGFPWTLNTRTPFGLSGHVGCQG